MSIKIFLSKIWGGIKTLFDSMPEEFKTAAQIAVAIVENLKTITDSPAIDILTAIIPGDLDNDLIAVLRASLPIILTDLKLAEATVPIDGNTITATAIKNIGVLSGNVKNAFLHDLGILLAQEITKAQNHQLSWSDGVYIIEWYYQHRFKKGN